MEFVSIVSDVTAEIDLSSLLKRVMEEATKMLMQIERHYFLTMKKHRNFFKGSNGGGVGEIRLPNSAGIAGSVFTSGRL